MLPFCSRHRLENALELRPNVNSLRQSIATPEIAVFASGMRFDSVASNAEHAMKLDHIGQSDNVEDRRGQASSFPGGMGGGRAHFGGGRLSIVTIVILGLVAWFMGIDPRLLIGGAEMVSGGGRQPQIEQQSSGSRVPAQDDIGKFVSQVLKLNEDVWGRVLPEQINVPFEKPRLVNFSQATRSACGAAQSAMGPFYCPLDQTVYLDTSFFNEMQRRLGGGGDFAYAYVISHEVGHHIQNQLGILPKIQAMQRRVDQVQANELSVRVELMADCLGGVWAHHAQKQFGVLQEGDVEEALRTASAIGDDRLQKQSQGYANQESFTHGSAEQRTRWLTQGLKTGDVNSCNTLNASDL
jgi:uncharacterized protein